MVRSAHYQSLPPKHCVISDGKFTNVPCWVEILQVDSWISLAGGKIESGNGLVDGLKALDAALERNTYLCGSYPSIADYLVFSALHCEDNNPSRFEILRGPWVMDERMVDQVSPPMLWQF